MANTYSVSISGIYSFLTKKGGVAPNTSLLVKMMKTTTEQYVKVLFAKLNQYLRQNGAIKETEEIFLQQRLEIDGREIVEYYLELLIKNSSEGKWVSGPVAKIDMMSKYIEWYIIYNGRYAYEFAENPEMFRRVAERAFQELLEVSD